MATCQGHRCSTWWKQEKRQGYSKEPPPNCLCGGRLPSRPHLLWNCEGTKDLMASVPLPVNRLQERLLAVEGPEVPAPPGVLDYEDLVDTIAEALAVRLSSGSPVYVATDGSVALDDVVFACNVDGEDQSAHRAEVEGLLALARALSRCQAHGEVHVIADCKAALLTVAGGGCTPLLSSRAVAAFALSQGRLRVQRWWVPSHGKVAPARWQPPPCGEVVARALNAKADRAARDKATRAAAGCARQACCRASERALEWEKQAHQAFCLVVRRWAEA